MYKLNKPSAFLKKIKKFQAVYIPNYPGYPKISNPSARNGLGLVDVYGYFCPIETTTVYVAAKAHELKVYFLILNFLLLQTKIEK